MSLSTPLKVRFVETDASGHLSHISLITYFEQARIEFLEAIGAATKIEDWRYVVGHVACDLHHPAYFNEELSVLTHVSHIGTKSFHLLHKVIRDDDGECIAEGKAVLIYMNFDTGHGEPIPQMIKEKLMDYQENQAS